jgi:hypothetical protein
MRDGITNLSYRTIPMPRKITPNCQQHRIASHGIRHDNLPMTVLMVFP